MGKALAYSTADPVAYRRTVAGANELVRSVCLVVWNGTHAHAKLLQ